MSLLEKREGNYLLECSQIYNNKYSIKCIYNKKMLDYYIYEKDKDYLERYSKKFYLTKEGKIDVLKCISDFDSFIEYVKDTYILVKYHNLTIYYKKIKSYYDLLIIKPNSIERTKTIDFHEWIDRTYYLDNNPLYLSAKKTNDLELELRIKDMYLYISKSEEDELTKITNNRFIRRKNDSNNYYIDRSEIIDKTNYKILINSGFKFYHKPCLAMKGFTYQNYTINIKTKCIIDASKIDAKIISFNKFINLFN